ncbi:hypothetical protein GQ53DRAFT_756221 [Thozetella sp. PMI_491]|nr:hypothetical protein GQ53DRAFT_756221 [Thozetella sp. PMI_491]
MSRGSTRWQVGKSRLRCRDDGTEVRFSRFHWHGQFPRLQKNAGSTGHMTTCPAGHVCLNLSICALLGLWELAKRV